MDGFWTEEGFDECVKTCANGENPEGREYVHLFWEVEDGWISIFDFENADEFINLVYVSFVASNLIIRPLQNIF